jgi:hypothetical protein
MGFAKVKDPKTARFYIRFSEQELATLKTKAQDSGMTMSEFARRRALGLRVVPRTDSQMLAELRRQGGSMRNLLDNMPRTPEQESHFLRVTTAYQTIVQAIKLAMTLQDKAE